MGALKASPQTKPQVIDFHDCRAFLTEWLRYLSVQAPGVSMRQLARSAGISASGLSMILKGHRSLTSETLSALRPHLQMDDAEFKHLELLRGLAEATTNDERAEVMVQIQKRRHYRNRHPREFETYSYLSNWYLVAIREMAALPGFRLDANWISSRLRGDVSTSQVKEAIDFLLQHGFIDKSNLGVAQKNLDCMGGVFRLALGTFHKEMMKQASRSIDRDPREHRHVLGHTFAFSQENLSQVKDILDEALSKIEQLKSTSSDTVYHVTLAAIPLSKREGTNE